MLIKKILILQIDKKKSLNFNLMDYSFNFNKKKEFVS